MKTPNVPPGINGGCFYLNKAAFAAQPSDSVGHLGWNSITGPAFWDVDLALSRRFRFHERHSVEVRADAFNISNSFVPSLASTSAPLSPAVPSFTAWSSAQFGQILTAFPMRKILFALKWAF